MIAALLAKLRFRERLLPILLGQGTGLLCGLLGVHFTTRLVSPATYGAYGIFISFTPLGVWVFHAGLIKWVSRHWAAVSVPKEALLSLIPSARRSIPWFVVAAFLLAATSALSSLIWTGTILCLSALGLSSGYLSQAGLQATRRHWADFSVSAVGAITRTAVPLLFYILAPHLLSLQAGFLVHAVCFGTVGLWALLNRPLSPNTANPPFKEIYGGRLFFALAITHGALTGMNRWIAGGFFSAEYAGWFTLASNIASVPTSMFGVIVSQWFQPDFFNQTHQTVEKRQALARRIDLIAFGFTVLAFSGLLILRFGLERIPGTFIDSKYDQALPLILAAGGFTSAIFVGQFYQTMLLAAHREDRCGWVDLPCGFILALGAFGSAWLGGKFAFEWFLCLSPLVPWLYNRSLARRFVFQVSA